MYQALHPTFPSEFKGHAIIAHKGGEPGNEASEAEEIGRVITKGMEGSIRLKFHLDTQKVGKRD